MRTVLIAVAFMCIMGAAMAEEVISGGTSYDTTGPAWVDQLANDNLNHSHKIDVPERDNPVGVGADVVVWESQSENVAVEVQGKYDTQNEETSAYVVTKVNLWKMLKK